MSRVTSIFAGRWASFSFRGAEVREKVGLDCRSDAFGLSRCPNSVCVEGCLEFLHPDSGSPLVVGTIHSPGALKKALKLKRGDVDVLELRVDAFVDAPEKLLRAVPGLAAPLLLTVRHPKEGGMAQYGLTERRHLVRQFRHWFSGWMLRFGHWIWLEAEIAHAVSMGVRLVVLRTTI